MENFDLGLKLTRSSPTNREVMFKIPGFSASLWGVTEGMVRQGRVFLKLLLQDRTSIVLTVVTLDKREDNTWALSIPAKKQQMQCQCTYNNFEAPLIDPTTPVVRVTATWEPNLEGWRVFWPEEWLRKEAPTPSVFDFAPTTGRLQDGRRVMDAHDNEAFAILHRYYDREHDKVMGGVENIAFDVACAIRAAFAAGREEAKDECQRAVIDALHPRDTWDPSYFGGYTDAMRHALAAIRALPSEGENE